MDTLSTHSLRHLRIFEAVARLESVSRASSEVHLSQPAVTQAVAKLEGDLGAPLFERRHTGTYATEAGVILRTRVQRMLREIHFALEGFLTDKGHGARALAGRAAHKLTRTHVRGLAAVAKLASLSDAAASSRISQLSLQRTLRDLGAILGRPLYKHTVHGNAATPEAVELARRIVLALHEIDYAIEEIGNARGLRAGRIAVGSLLLGSSYLIGTAVTKLTRRYPDVQVRIVNDGYNTLLHELRSGAIDVIVGLMRNTAAEDVAEEPLFLDPYVPVVRLGHPLTRKGRLTKDDLAGYDWVVPARGAVRRAAFERLFAGMRRQPRTGIETYSLTTITAILAESDHITLLTRHEMQFETRMGLLTTLAFGPLEPAAAIGMTTRADWHPTEAQRAFLQLLRAEAAKINDGRRAPEARNLPVSAGRL